MALQLADHERVVGPPAGGLPVPQVGFLGPSTLSLLEEHGFVWDSSLMGRDFEVYRPRPVVAVDREQGNTFGPPSPIVEIPVSWYLDDFPFLEQLPRRAGRWVQSRSLDFPLEEPLRLRPPTGARWGLRLDGASPDDRPRPRVRDVRALRRVCGRS